MMESALGTNLGGTRRIVVAAAIPQNPPRPTPNKIRPVSKKVKFGESATKRLDRTCNTQNAKSIHRLSVFLVNAPVNRLEAMATIAVTDIAWPAVPSLTFRLLAIGVSKLTGKNSEMIRQATPRDIAYTAFQDGWRSATDVSNFNSGLSFPAMFIASDLFFRCKSTEGAAAQVKRFQTNT